MKEQTVLTLVRHGQTRANLDGVWHGSLDTALTAHGHEQARRVGAYVGESRADAVAVYASPLERAHDTARAIAEQLGHPIHIDGDLVEYGLGEWEGRPYVDLHHVERMFHQMAEDPDFTPPGGESPRQVATRMGQAFRRICSLHPGERVVVVTHGGALSLVLGLLLDGSPNTWNRVVDNCSVSDLVLDPKPELLSFNLTDHLAA